MERRSFVHLAAGFSILPAVDAPPKLGARRKEQIERVEGYAKKGVFPRNIDFKGERVPYFVDDRGVPCAVAFLMIEDGLRDAVERIAKESNHVRIMDVKEGPIVDWVLSSGVLQEEAAQIQPSYDDGGGGAEIPPDDFEPRDPAIVERDRIRGHLFSVVVNLRATTKSSLATAEERLRKARIGG